MRQHERGSALIIATIVMLIIAVIGVGMVRFTQRQTAGATAGLRADTVSACAEAGRNMLLSRFHLFGQDPVKMEVVNTRVDGPDGRMRVAGGHIDVDPTQLPEVVKQVELKQDLVYDPHFGDDLSNRIVGNRGLGGAPYRAVVHCQEGDLSGPDTGRQIEIEFAVKFGL